MKKIDAQIVNTALASDPNKYGTNTKTYSIWWELIKLIMGG